jgi:hypothetical protein
MMKPPRFAFAALAAVSLMSAAAFAADPTGNWKWSIVFNDQTFDTSAHFDLKDGKLSGTLSTQMGDLPIADGTCKDDAVAFTLTFDGDASAMVIKYHGKLAGDTITGSIDVPGFNGGEARTVDWKATRVKDAPAPADAPKPN